MNDLNPIKLVILDRDGVINKDSDDHIRHPDDFIPIARSLEAIGKLTKGGFKIAIATNQSGIGRGYFSHEAFESIHAKLDALLVPFGGKIDKVFYCPHVPENGCDCRKPKPGLLHQIKKHYQCELETVPMVGDSLCDLKAALSAGATPYYVKTGENEDISDFEDILTFNDLFDAVDYILSQ